MLTYHSKKSRPFVLAETDWEEMQKHNHKVAILPWGATEAHNYHLPYGTDNIQAEFVAIASAEKAWKEGTKSIVLPTIPFGFNSGQLDIKLCMHLGGEAQYAILKDVAFTLSNHRIDKLIIVNGHGGNSFKSMIRDLSVDYPDLFVCSMNWFKAADWNHYFSNPGDHAGQMETSSIMHITPHLVQMDQAGDGNSKNYKVKGLKEGWVSAQRKWTEISQDTGVGNPSGSSKEAGKQFLDACIENISDFIIDLSNSDLKEFYE